MNGHQACSHQWQDEATRGQLSFVDHAITVSPIVEHGNWQAMQPGHTYVCATYGRSFAFPAHRPRTSLTNEAPLRLATTLSTTRPRSTVPTSTPQKGTRWSPDCRSWRIGCAFGSADPRIGG